MDAILKKKTFHPFPFPEILPTLFVQRLTFVIKTSIAAQAEKEGIQDDEEIGRVVFGNRCFLKEKQNWEASVGKRGTNKVVPIAYVYNTPKLKSKILFVLHSVSKGIICKKAFLLFLVQTQLNTFYKIIQLN